MTNLKNSKLLKNVVIKDILDHSVVEMLASFGFSIGSTLKVISKLPFNGAITCESNHTRIAIRAADAANIIVMD